MTTILAFFGNKPVSLNSMDKIISDLKRTGFQGECDDSPASLDAYSHDASMFELRSAVRADRRFPEISWHSRSEALDVKRLRLGMVE